MISYWHNVDLIWSWYQTDIKPSRTGSLLEEEGYMIHGKWGVHALCMPNNTKMANQIVIKFKRIAHHTQRNIHTQKHLRDDWWRQYLPFVSGTHWTLVYFTHKQTVMRGLWHSYKCSREQPVELTFELPVVWGVIVLISTYEISVDFHIRLN